MGLAETQRHVPQSGLRNLHITSLIMEGHPPINQSYLGMPVRAESLPGYSIGLFPLSYLQLS